MLLTVNVSRSKTEGAGKQLVLINFREIVVSRLNR